MSGARCSTLVYTSFTKARLLRLPYVRLNSDDAANVSEAFCRLVPERSRPVQYWKPP